MNNIHESGINLKKYSKSVDKTNFREYNIQVNKI